MRLVHTQVCEEKQAEAEQHAIPALDEEAEPQEVSDHAVRKRQCRLLHVVAALFKTTQDVLLYSKVAIHAILW